MEEGGAEEEAVLSLEQEITVTISLVVAGPHQVVEGAAGDAWSTPPHLVLLCLNTEGEEEEAAGAVVGKAHGADSKITVRGKFFEAGISTTQIVYNSRIFLEHSNGTTIYATQFLMLASV